jgi:hypothetical protein
MGNDPPNYLKDFLLNSVFFLKGSIEESKFLKGFVTSLTRSIGDYR